MSLVRPLRIYHDLPKALRTKVCEELHLLSTPALSFQRARLWFIVRKQTCFRAVFSLLTCLISSSRRIIPTRVTMNTVCTSITSYHELQTELPRTCTGMLNEAVPPMFTLYLHPSTFGTTRLQLKLEQHRCFRTVVHDVSWLRLYGSLAS